MKDPVSGLSHFTGFVLALVGFAWLTLRGSSHPAMTASVAAYGASLVALYAASSAYHLIIAGERTTRVLRTFDHVAIFLLIAGTFTPVFWRAFEGTSRTVMLAGVWGVGVAGIALRVFWWRAPRALYTTLYVAMGWMVVPRWSAVAHAIPVAAAMLVVAGGVVYTLGAVVYALRWPNPFPRVFGFHEIWHIFVLGGSALHFAAVASL